MRNRVASEASLKNSTIRRVEDSQRRVGSGWDSGFPEEGVDSFSTLLLKSEGIEKLNSTHLGRWKRRCLVKKLFRLQRIEYHRLSANAEMVQYRADLSHMC